MNVSKGYFTLKCSYGALTKFKPSCQFRNINKTQGNVKLILATGFEFVFAL